jgi:hypothetical protein
MPGLREQKGLFPAEEFGYEAATAATHQGLEVAVRKKVGKEAGWDT